MQNIINEFIKPELLIIIPVLYIIGEFLKTKCNIIKNCYIPLILVLISTALSTLWVLSISTITTYQGLFASLFTSITQGVLIAGATVLSYEIIKNTKSFKTLTPDIEQNNQPINIEIDKKPLSIPIEEKKETTI
ncbi:MAG: hypothetical protein KFW09_05860 [Oscillospiraceae bacterium]|nr:hypothetical protein [Oscillospiraceae bacterium]